MHALRVVLCEKSARRRFRHSSCSCVNISVEAVSTNRFARKVLRKTMGAKKSLQCVDRSHKLNMPTNKIRIAQIGQVAPTKRVGDGVCPEFVTFYTKICAQLL